MDLGCCKNTITDVRMLFTSGVDKVKWQWSDAGESSVLSNDFNFVHSRNSPIV
jgi:hypothetical protein